jgi:hypothetical protein
MIRTCAGIDKYAFYLDFKGVLSSTPQVSVHFSWTSQILDQQGRAAINEHNPNMIQHKRQGAQQDTKHYRQSTDGVITK